MIEDSRPENRPVPDFVDLRFQIGPSLFDKKLLWELDKFLTSTFRYQDRFAAFKPIGLEPYSRHKVQRHARL
jgi:hypothetical protein